jgi:Rieske Fe-S protein
MMAEGGEMNRRSFLERVLRGGTILAGLTTAASAIAYFGSGSSMRRKYERLHRIGDIEHFPVGYSRVLKIQSDIVLVARVAEDRLVALSAVCPHKGCLVEWIREEARLSCPCHAAQFDMKGNVLSGPPRRGLLEYTIDVIGSSIYLKV